MRSGKLVAAFAVLLVVSFAVMNAMPSDTLPAALLQETVLALVAFAAVGFAIPDALKRCTQTVQHGVLCGLQRSPCSWWVLSAAR